MKAIGYIRVSTEEQARDGISLDMQRAKISAYAQLEELELIDVIEDAGISGCSIKGRPGIQEVLSLVRNRRINCVVIYKLDRLARNTSEALDIARLCDSNDISLHSITERLDTKSAIGRFFFTLLASLAEMERAIISERITDAMSRKRELGLPRGHAPYGMRVVNGQLVLDPYEQAVIQEIISHHSQGLTIYQIVDALKKTGRVNRKGKPLAKSQVHSIIIKQRKAA